MIKEILKEFLAELSFFEI